MGTAVPCYRLLHGTRHWMHVVRAFLPSSVRPRYAPLAAQLRVVLQECASNQETAVLRAAAPERGVEFTLDPLPSPRPGRCARGWNLPHKINFWSVPPPPCCGRSLAQACFWARLSSRKVRLPRTLRQDPPSDLLSGRDLVHLGHRDLNPRRPDRGDRPWGQVGPHSSGSRGSLRLQRSPANTHKHTFMLKMKTSMGYFKQHCRHGSQKIQCIRSYFNK